MFIILLMLLCLGASTKCNYKQFCWLWIYLQPDTIYLSGMKGFTLIFLDFNHIQLTKRIVTSFSILSQYDVLVQLYDVLHSNHKAVAIYQIYQPTTYSITVNHELFYILWCVITRNMPRIIKSFETYMNCNRNILIFTSLAKTIKVDGY